MSDFDNLLSSNKIDNLIYDRNENAIRVTNSGSGSVAGTPSSVGSDPGNISVNTSPTLLLAANLSRKKLLIQNKSDEITMYLGGAAVDPTSSLVILPFGIYTDEMPYCGTEAIYGVAASGSINVSVKEWE